MHLESLISARDYCFADYYIGFTFTEFNTHHQLD